MSAIELSEYIETLTGVAYTPRSVQRNLKKAGSIRTASEAFNLAIKKGRVSFAYQDPIFEAKKARNTFSKKQRFEILTRDNFTCQLCGATAKTDILEVDHITPLSEGGTHEPDNLRTLCNSCNVGKQHHDKEFAKRGFRFTITPK